MIEDIFPDKKTPKEFMEAIFEAWDFYDKPHGSGILGSPEADRIYRAIRSVAIKRFDEASQKGH